MLDHFFQTIATLMSNMLREAVASSLDLLVAYIERYSAGNHFDGAYEDYKFCLPQVGSSENVSLIR